MENLTSRNQSSHDKRQIIYDRVIRYLYDETEEWKQSIKSKLNDVKNNDDNKRTGSRGV